MRHGSNLGWHVVVALALTLTLAFSTVARASVPLPAPSLPESERLRPVRSALEKTIDQAARDGLPADLLVVKVREGLAKGVPPETIRAAVERLARDLGDASQFLRAHRKQAASPALVRSLADTRTSGIELEAMLPLIASGADDRQLMRVIDVLTDLGLRGYPGRRAVFVVKEVFDRDPGSVGRIVAGVESIRRGQTVSRAEALEMLGRNALSSDSFDAALKRSLEGREHGNGVANGKNGQSGDHQGVAATKKGMGMGMK